VPEERRPGIEPNPQRDPQRGEGRGGHRRYGSDPGYGERGYRSQPRDPYRREPVQYEGREPWYGASGRGNQYQARPRADGEGDDARSDGSGAHERYQDYGDRAVSDRRGRRPSYGDAPAEYKEPARQDVRRGDGQGSRPLQGEGRGGTWDVRGRPEEGGRAIWTLHDDVLIRERNLAPLL
jgi:hypothetical protein